MNDGEEGERDENAARDPETARERWAPTPPGDRSVNVTDGRLFVPLVVLSAPVVVAYTLDIVYYVVDLYWIGYLGTDAVAAMSYSWPILFLFTSLGIGITTAGTVLVAQNKGAGRLARSHHVAGQTVSVVSVLSVAIAALGYLLAPWMLALIGATPGSDPHTMAVSYTRITFLGMVPIFWFFVFDALSRGWGDTRTPLYLMAASVGVNVVLDPFVILGFAGNPVFAWFGVEALGTTLYERTGFDGYGIEGAALASVFSRTLAALVALSLLFSGAIGLRVDPSELRPNRESVAEIVEIGVPTSLEMGLRASGVTVMTAIVALEGDTAIAAYGISEYLAALLLVPAIGLARGTETVVGQNLGAGQTQRAKHAVYMSAAIVVTAFVVVVAAAYPVAESIVGLFVSAEPGSNAAAEVVRIGSAFIWIIGPTYVFYGVFQVVLGAFRGSGHTRLALAFAVMELWAVRLPLSVAALRWFDAGVVGIWYAFAASYVLSTLVTAAWFLRGTWTTPVVDR
ncbi:MATE family efflux transporter [Natronorarus salvus]|uniref:MATE family efflux transporter n=1 Tax=Natronorarus salvus TaxID=3117733 RepID=UPI002F268FBA